ncbi:MAG: ferrous iron transport protein A [Rhizobacter sp.]|nr:ferrous iron transport protein A [Chlorobiales bacterium]
MLLKDVRKGQHLKIQRIEDAGVRTQLVRFGIGEGSTVRCHERIPFGPIVVKRGRQEVAIGREIAKAIHVELISITEPA